MSSRCRVSLITVAGEDRRELTGASPGYPFKEAIPSFNLSSSRPLSYTVEMMAEKASGEKTDWLYLGGENMASRRRATESAGVRAETDHLQSPDPLISVSLRIVSGDPDLSADRLSVSFSETGPDCGAAGPEDEITGAVELDVPFRSQRSEDESIAMSICSPTSVCAIMEYYGRKVDTAEFAMRARDPETGMFGIWHRAVQAAYAEGFSGLVRHFSRMSEAWELLKRGVPVAACIVYGRGELTGSWTEESEGHVTVISGFDGRGRVTVCDSAAPPGHGPTKYSLAEFAEAWLRRAGGVGYVIAPKLQ